MTTETTKPAGTEPAKEVLKSALDLVNDLAKMDSPIPTEVVEKITEAASIDKATSEAMDAAVAEVAESVGLPADLITGNVPGVITETIVDAAKALSVPVESMSPFAVMLKAADAPQTSDVSTVQVDPTTVIPPPVAVDVLAITPGSVQIPDVDPETKIVNLGGQLAEVIHKLADGDPVKARELIKTAGDAFHDRAKDLIG